jgi:hypothetical protein
MTRRSSHTGKKVRSARTSGDLLSPQLLRLVLPLALTSAPGRRISDRALALYFEGALGPEDADEVRSAIEEDQAVSERFKQLAQDLRSAVEVEGAQKLPPALPEVRPQTNRVHLGEISWKRLEADPFGSAEHFAEELLVLLTRARKRASGAAMAKAEMQEAANLADRIKTLVTGVGRVPKDEPVSAHFSTATLNIDVLLQDTGTTVVIKRGENYPLRGVEVTLVADDGQLHTVASDDKGLARLPFPSSRGSILLMVEPTLEIGIRPPD